MKQTTPLQERVNDMFRQQHINETFIQRCGRMHDDDEWLHGDYKECSFKDKCWYKINIGPTIAYRLKGTDIFLCNVCRSKGMYSHTMNDIITASLTPSVSPGPTEIPTTQ